MKFDKPKSRKYIEIITSDIDDWFLFVCKYQKSDNKLLSKSMIIRKDLQTWINSYLSQGWNKID